MRAKPKPMKDATRGDRIVDALWQRTGWRWTGKWLTARRHRRWTSRSRGDK